jgi:hypothetical protein
MPTATATPRSLSGSRSSESVMSLLAAKALGGQGRKDQLSMRLDPLRMAVAALELGPDIALAPFLSPPPDRARRADPKSLRRRSTRQSALNRANDTPAKVNR